MESEEVGLLLGLWAASDPERSLLGECARTLVRDDDPHVEPAVARLAAALGSADFAPILDAIVLGLGRSLRKKIATAPERFLDDFRSIAGADVDRVRGVGAGTTPDPLMLIPIQIASAMNSFSVGCLTLFALYPCTAFH